MNLGEYALFKVEPDPQMEKDLETIRLLGLEVRDSVIAIATEGQHCECYYENLRRLFQPGGAGFVDLNAHHCGKETGPALPITSRSKQ